MIIIDKKSKDDTDLAVSNLKADIETLFILSTKSINSGCKKSRQHVCGPTYILFCRGNYIFIHWRIEGIY